MYYSKFKCTEKVLKKVNILKANVSNKWLLDVVLLGTMTSLQNYPGTKKAEAKE